MPPKLTAVVNAPLHTAWSLTAFTFGVGLTVIVNVLGVPVHDPYTGVTVMVATEGALPLLMAANEVMFPVPLAARPMLVLSLVQVKAVAVPVKVTAVVFDPLHNTWLAITATVGVG